MAASNDSDRLRRRLDANPADDEARAELAAALAAAGDREGAAEAFYLAACAARRRGEEALFRDRIRQCLQADPDYPLVFTEPPLPLEGEREAWARLLVVHPESRVRGPLARLLADRGYAVEEAATAGSARTALRQTPADLVITAPSIVDGDALAVAQAARRARPQAALILLTCAARAERIESPAELQPLVDEHLDRPLPPDRLLAAVRAALWRHRHAAQVVPAAAPPPATAHPAWKSALARSVLIVGIGYGILLTLDAALGSARTAQVVERARTSALSERPLPPEISWDQERALWVKLTTRQATPMGEVTVTALEPELVAARVFRAAREARKTASHDEVETAIDRLASEAVVSFEIHVTVDDTSEVDPAAVVSSLRLRTAGRPEIPARTPPAAAPAPPLRFVRESRPSLAPRTRALTFVATFPRAPLADARVYALSLALGGEPVLLLVPARSKSAG